MIRIRLLVFKDGGFRFKGQLTGHFQTSDDWEEPVASLLRDVAEITAPRCKTGTLDGLGRGRRGVCGEAHFYAHTQVRLRSEIVSVIDRLVAVPEPLWVWMPLGEGLGIHQVKQKGRQGGWAPLQVLVL